MSRALAVLPSLILIALGAASAGCGDDGGGTGGGGSSATGAGGNGARVDAVVYEGGATDEAFVELTSLTPTSDAAQQPSFTSPDDGATIAAGTVPTFAWALPRHGDPVNGRAYLLTFRAGGAVVLDVFTLLEAYTPTDAVWAEVAAATDPVEVELITAVFENNRVPQDGGPFLGDTLTLTVE